MTKKLAPGLLCVFLATAGMAQVGIGTTTPDASAQLEIQSTSKGLLIPRVTSTGNVPAPAEGLLVYQTTSPVGFYVYQAGSWVRLVTTADGSGSSSGTIIPYASGTPVTMRGGSLKGVSLVGFGNSASPVYAINGGIDLSGGGGAALNFAFSVPRSGTITSLSGYFSTIASFNLPGSVSVIAQLYLSTGSTNSFTPIAGAGASLTPALTGMVSPNAISTGLVSGLAIPVVAGSRLLLAFYVSTADASIIVNGYVSGGVTIE